MVLPEDFEFDPSFVPPDEAARLADHLAATIPWEDPILTIAGRPIAVPRRVAFFGPHDYAYSGIVHPACPMPPAVADLRHRVEEASRHPYNTVLMNLYRSGADSVSWHSDDDYPHGGHPAVASVSLGGPRRFLIASKKTKRKDERFTIELTSGSLLLMGGRSQLDYRHALPKTARPVLPRVNLTFRYMARPNT